MRSSTPDGGLVHQGGDGDLRVDARDATAGPDLRFGLGFQLAAPSMPGLGPASFGHTGAGGRLLLADPDLDVAFGYVCNSARDIGPGGDPRWATLLTALRACL